MTNKMNELFKFETLTEEEAKLTKSGKIDIIKNHIMGGINMRQEVLNRINKAIEELDTVEIDSIIKEYYE